jgi:hypothetical protein
MDRLPMYGALAAGVVLTAVLLPSAVAAADPNDPGAPGGASGNSADPNNPAPPGATGPSYGDNIDGWVVKINYLPSTPALPLTFQSPIFTQNIANLDPAAGSPIQQGTTATVKGKPSASSIFGAKEPANMDVMLVVGSSSDGAARVAVRDSSGYDTPANVSCDAARGTRWQCRVDSSAKNQPIVVSMWQ